MIILKVELEGGKDSEIATDMTIVSDYTDYIK